MRYAYQLRAYANARYQDSVLSLSQKELTCMLAACGVQACPDVQILGGAPFLCFETEGLTPAQSAFLSGFSALYMACAMEGELLRPLNVPRVCNLPPDMPEILKYKGKTNPAFTNLCLNLALSAGGLWRETDIRVLDPICGHGTTLFCALTRGMNGMGVENSRKDLSEGITFTQKWLQYHRLKHAMNRESATLPGGKSAAGTLFSIRDGNRNLHLDFYQADTADTGQILRKKKVHAIVADLPYGVQHAPTEGKNVSTLEKMLKDALPAWREALLPGCAAAIAFNTYTLKREILNELCVQAGFDPMNEPAYQNFEHWVEQAVNRDVLVARRPEKG